MFWMEALCLETRLSLRVWGVSVRLPVLGVVVNKWMMRGFGGGGEEEPGIDTSQR